MLHILNNVRDTSPCDLNQNAIVIAGRGPHAHEGLGDNRRRTDKQETNVFDVQFTRHDITVFNGELRKMLILQGPGNCYGASMTLLNFVLGHDIKDRNDCGGFDYLGQCVNQVCQRNLVCKVLR